MCHGPLRVAMATSVGTSLSLGGSGNKGQGMFLGGANPFGLLSQQRREQNSHHPAMNIHGVRGFLLPASSAVTKHMVRVGSAWPRWRAGG